MRESLHRQRRSLGTEVTVQLLVVVDKEMISFHGNQSVEKYVLTVMNMVNEQLLIHNFDLDKWGGGTGGVKPPASRTL